MRIRSRKQLVKTTFPPRTQIKQVHKITLLGTRGYLPLFIVIHLFFERL